MFNDRLSLSSQAVARHPDSSLRSKRRRSAEVAPGSRGHPGRPAGHTAPHPTPLLSLGTKPCGSPALLPPYPYPRYFISAFDGSEKTPPVLRKQLSCRLSHFFMGTGTPGLPNAFVCSPSGQRGILSRSPKGHREHRDVFSEPSEPPAAGDAVVSRRSGAFIEGGRGKTFRSHLQVTVSRRQPSAS